MGAQASIQKCVKAEGIFLRTWEKDKESLEKVVAVFKIQHNLKQHRKVQKKIGNIELMFHGTKVYCEKYAEVIANFVTDCKTIYGTFDAKTNCCTNPHCPMCDIIQHGYQVEKFGTGTGVWGRFGKGLYFTENSSKANDYNLLTELYCRKNYRCVLLNSVAVGKPYYADKNMVDINQAPAGYNSVVGLPPGKKVSTKGSKIVYHSGLNYHEIAVYNNKYVIPKYIIVYKLKDEPLPIFKDLPLIPQSTTAFHPQDGFPLESLPPIK